MDKPPKKYSNFSAFNGLANAHKLGMSWGKIALIVSLVVAVFLISIAFSYFSSQNNPYEEMLQTME